MLCCHQCQRGRLLKTIIQLYIAIDVTQSLHSNRAFLVVTKLKRLQYQSSTILEESKFNNQVQTKIGQSLKDSSAN